jgi:3-deoxy-manno-octulosonate cytidylyltransferase (CMP-KDO synthetase)
MNLQGDEPLMNLEDIRNLNDQMIKNKSQLGTLASKISDKALYENENIVKVNTKEKLDDLNFPEAINFMRKNSEQVKNIYHHLGIYCYDKETIKKFISFNQSYGEIKNRLEQLRALENKISINVALAKSSPIGVDTEEDFLAIKKIMEYKS